MNLFKDDSNNIVALVKGNTKVLVKVYSELAEPYRKNTNEG